MTFKISKFLTRSSLLSKEGDDLKFEDFEKFENTVKLIEDTRECVKKTLRRFLS